MACNIEYYLFQAAGFQMYHKLQDPTILVLPVV